MKRKIYLLAGIAVVAALGGCGNKSSTPDGVATAKPSSKPNPWSIGGNPSPSPTASVHPAPKPSPSGSAKANPWGMTTPAKTPTAVK
jgi:hypothetical protein